MTFPRVECPEPVEGLCCVYILHCANDTLYVGQTNNVPERIRRHYVGSGARHTRLLAPFKLVYVEGPMNPDHAIARERQLKKWSRSKKQALIMGNLDALKRLAKSND